MDDLYQSLEEIKDTLRTRHRFNEQLRDDVRQIRECLKTLDESVRGNGKPGLNTRVARLEDRGVLLWSSIGVVAGGLVTAMIAKFL